MVLTLTLINTQVLILTLNLHFLPMSLDRLLPPVPPWPSCSGGGVGVRRRRRGGSGGRSAVLGRGHSGMSAGSRTGRGAAGVLHTPLGMGLSSHWAP